MWARTVEVMFGCWLILSPLALESKSSLLVSQTVGAGALLILFALLSFARRFQHAHFMSLLVAGWLIGSSYHLPVSPEIGIVQSNVFFGWLILLFAILPNEASLPPRPWRKVASNRNPTTRLFWES